MLTDARGVPVSDTSPRALEYFEQALMQFHAYLGDPIETIDKALAEDPEFVLGHLFKALVLATTTEQRYVPTMRAALAEVEKLSRKANDRERDLAQALRLWLGGDWPGAGRTLDVLLERYPQDALAIQVGHLVDFFNGDASNLRNRIARVLPQWSEESKSYSYVLGMYAFGLEECNLYAQAEDTARRALAIEPVDGWTVHAIAHVMEMQGRVDEGIDFYRTRQSDWATSDNGFAFHNWWHLALYHLDRGELAQAFELYDGEIYPTPSDMTLQMIDASAFLWRTYLQDANASERWKALADKWEEKADDENGFYAFNDFHAMLAFVADERPRVAERLLADMQKIGAGKDTNAMMTREVGLPACRAVQAFASGRYEEAIEYLLPIRTIANRFGGSHAQRDLLSQTLLEAAIRAGRHGLAHNLVNERTEHKPHSPLAWRFRGRALRAAGDDAGAAKAERVAAGIVSGRRVA